MKLDQIVYGLKKDPNQGEPFCAEDSVGEYHGKDEETRHDHKES